MTQSQTDSNLYQTTIVRSWKGSEYPVGTLVVVSAPESGFNPGRIHPVGYPEIDWPFFANEIEPALDEPEWDGDCRCGSDVDNPCVCN